MARTVINLDDKLVREAMRRTGLKRKVDVVNEGLRVLVAQRRLVEPSSAFAARSGGKAIPIGCAMVARVLVDTSVFGHLIAQGRTGSIEGALGLNVS